ncbi:MAG: ribosomal RNA small subunit methyltransferase I [Candidatus Paceibacterota bacterium]
MHEGILADLETGKHIALVSDAGTPGVSDPGVLLVARAREAGALVEAVPGASALTAAFSISGIIGNGFVFIGFVPHKKGRQTFFKEIAEEERPVIFYESPHRIIKTLTSLAEILTPKQNKGDEGLPIDWKVIVARELTKMFEEVVEGTPEEVLEYFTLNPDKVRGEFVVMVT